MNKTKISGRIKFPLEGVLSLMLLLGPVMVQASGLPQTLNLDESIQQAFKESPALRSAQVAIQGAEFKKDQARSGFLPKLGTQYNYSHVDKAPFVRTPAQNYGSIQIPSSTTTIGTQDNYALYLILEQPIFTGMAITRNYELAELGVDVSRIKLAQERLNLAYKVKEAYWNILKAQKLYMVADQTVSQIADHVRVAQDYYNVGLIPLNDLLKSEVQLADAKQNLIKAENSLLLAKSNFNTLLRLPFEKDTEVQDILTYQPFTRPWEDCLQEALKRRPEIREIETQIEMAQKNIQLAQSEYFPQVVLQGRYIKQGDSPGVSGSPFVYADNWDIVAAMKWNLWEWGRTHYLEQERIKQREQVKETLTQIKDFIRLEVKDAYLILREAEKSFTLAEKSIAQAEENHRISEFRYREQVATSLEVLDAQTLLTQAKNNLYQALYAYNLAHSRLMRAMGTW